MAPSIWQLLIVLVIVLLLFGTKRLKGLGGDLGGAIKGFKNAMSDEEKKNGETIDQEDPAKVTDDTNSAASENVAQKETSKNESKS